MIGKKAALQNSNLTVVLLHSKLKGIVNVMHNLRLPSNGSAPSLASYKAGGAGIVHLIFTGQKEKKTTKTRQEIIRRVISPDAGIFPQLHFRHFFAEGPCSANRLLQGELLLVSTDQNSAVS